MKNPNYVTNLLNTLKNRRRLQILNLISHCKKSVSTLQKELKSLGYYHSQQTVTKEYLMPLIEVGLAKENQSQYSTTLFGCQLNKIIKNYHDIDNLLPAHSECYEEIVLNMILNKPKTYADFEGVIPTKSIARILNRLQNADLIETTKENDYIFFFRTKRDSRKAQLSPTEERIYENIPEDGISARKLCGKVGISLRRTYKYLRRLKGKKLVFTRRVPKIYALTTKGVQLAMTLRELNDLTFEAFRAATQTVNKEEKHELLTLEVNQKSGKKEKKTVPSTNGQHIE